MSVSVASPMGFANDPSAAANNSLAQGDHPSVLSYCLGITLSLLCLPGLIGNILVSYVEISKGLLSSNNSSMYNLSFNLIIADTLHLAVIAFYLGPASAAQDWLTPDNWTREIPGRVLMLCWHNMVIDLILLAANRYVAVCQPQRYAVWFSKKNTKIMIWMSWLIGLLICVVGEQLLPCCSLYLYYKVYSYAFLDQTSINYNNWILVIPMNTLATLVVIIAYALVIYNVHVTNTRVADKIAPESQQRRRTREIRYAFQLIIISAVFVSVWVLFNMFSHVIPVEQSGNGWFSVVVILEIVNASANSVVCILFNKEINGTLKKLCCGCWCQATEQQGSTQAAVSMYPGTTHT